MQYLKGKLNSIKEFDTLLRFIEEQEQKGLLILYLPYRSDEITLCFDGTKVYVEGTFSGPPELALKRFLEKWLLSGKGLHFELYDSKSCSSEFTESMSYVRFERIIRDPCFKKVREIPEKFHIKWIDVKAAPSSLISYWALKKPITREELYSLNLSLCDIAKLVDEHKLKIRVYIDYESLSKLSKALIIILIAVSAVYVLVPTHLKTVNMFKLMEAQNWGLREKIVSPGTHRIELPVKDCYGKNVQLIGNYVVSSGIDRRINFGIDEKKELPAKGYKPFFALPVK